jgi:FG-GAP repeat
MHVQTPKVSGASRLAVLALALLLASCIFDKSYKIGGTVIGKTGTGLVLQNNGGDNLAATANGPFTFPKEVKKGKGYNVTAFVQPSGQTCAIINGSGTANSSVTDVTVNCGGTYTVGGTVSGLTGTGLVLQNNGGNNLPVSGNGGAFTFSAPVSAGGAYSVTVLTQPSGQNCTVSNGAGTSTTNVTGVAVACAGVGFTVGGAVSGLTGAGLVLQINSSSNLAIAGDGPFMFSTVLANAAMYSVTVLSQPTGQGCSVANGSGTIAGANVGNVAVTCAVPPGAPAVNLSFGLKELQFSWGAAAGAMFYRLLENPDGVSGYTLAADNIAATSYNYTIPLHKRMNASYIVEACNAGGCNGSQPQNVSSQLLTQAIGYAKASNIVATSVGIGDQFGQSVAVSGDGNTLAVGAPNEDSLMTGVTAGDVSEATAGNGANNAGAVYVFARIGGVWAQQAYVKASNTAASAFFGGAVALSGDGNTLAVGASGAEAAYVFTRSGTTWAQQAIVTASNAEAGDLFSAVLALSGDGNTLAVGAFNEASEVAGVIPGAPTESATPNAASGGKGAGAVYVYTRSGAAWSQQAYVKASNPEASDPNLGISGDLFGSAIALSGNGNTLAVGASFESSALTGIRSGPVSEVTAGNGSSMSGAAYVYLRTGTTWTQQAYVKASNTGDFDMFGSAVALSSDGNSLAVGAPGEASSGTGIDSASDELASGSGAVYVYSRSGSTWLQQAFVKATNTGSNDSFGSAVALSGDGNTLAVGAPMEDGSGFGAVGITGAVYDDLAADAGAAYVYTRSGGTWSTQTFVKASNSGTGDQFGWALTLSDDGNTLAIGARMEDGVVTGIGTAPGDGVVTSKDAGAVYLY